MKMRLFFCHAALFCAIAGVAKMARKPNDAASILRA